MTNFREIAVILISLICIEFLACNEDIDHDPRFRKVVKDFEDLLRHKIATEHNTGKAFKTDHAIKVSDLEHSDKFTDDYSIEEDNNNAPEFDIAMQNLAHQNPDNTEHLQAFDKEPSASKSFVENTGRETSDTKQNQEEILYIRRSNSGSSDPISEVIKEFIHDSSSHRQTEMNKPGIQETDAETASDIDGSLAGKILPNRHDNNFEFHEINTGILSDDAGSRDSQNPRRQDDQSFEAEAVSDDACVKGNFAANLHQTCPGGPEYELKFHSQFSKVLKQDMDKMVPNLKEDKCDFLKSLERNASVEDRALCPFEWYISSRDPSRIPEYLYEAHCSCQTPRKVYKEEVYEIKKFYCSEVKRLIPVLWIVDCKDGKKKYRQGWQEVAVSCEPVEIRTVESIRPSSPQ